MASVIELNEEDFSDEGIQKMKGLYREAYPEIEADAIYNFPRPIFYLDSTHFEGMVIDGKLHESRTVTG